MADQAAAANATNGTARATPEGIVLAYSGLYAMALLSIWWGAYRSARLVHEHRRDNKKMESSITFSDAKWFPVTASCVLFGLYCLFKKNECLRLLRDVVYTPLLHGRLPENLDHRLNEFLSAVVINASEPAGSNDSASGSPDRANGPWELLTRENVSYALLVFFCYEGVFALARLLKPFVSLVAHRVPQAVRRRLGPFQHYRLSLTRSRVEPVNHDDVHDEEKDDENGAARRQFIDARFDTHDLVSVAMCTLVGVFHVRRRHWLTNNAFGLAFTLYGVEALHLSSFKAGAVLLAGLFVYDVFWVFATDVMSTVATTVNAPILLMFPQDFLGGGSGPTKFAMLGLGDIVIPGVFLALLLRYGEQRRDRSYFYVTTIAYALGLMLTIGVMHYFKAAQPALLYLVPACLGAPVLLALFKSDLKNLLAYDEADLVKDDDKNEKRDVRKNEKKQK